MFWRISARVCLESKKEMCCAQGMPTMTLKPNDTALSSSHFGGSVKVRKQLIPASAIRPKSVSTFAGSGNGIPERAGEKGPYVTPFKKNFLSFRKKNRPRGRIFSDASKILLRCSSNAARGRRMSGVSRSSRDAGIGMFTMDRSLFTRLFESR